MAGRLDACERARIEVLLAEGFSDARIASRLGRSRATIWRERRRCVGGYDAERAQADALARAARPRAHKLAADSRLCERVQRRLDERLSPHAVAAELKDHEVKVCAETIYRACYDTSATSALRADTYKNLPRSRRRRKPRRGCERAKRSVLGNYRPIAERPSHVEARDEPGHWEGDLIIGARNRSAVATLVERTSRLTLVVALPHGYDAHSTAAAVAAALVRQPQHLPKTLTWDQGSEMTRWPDIETATGVKVFFADPHNPWQRPTNEQTNALLRRWLPKGTNLNIGPARLAVIEDRLNTMPRKLHNWNTAHSVYTALSRDHH